MKIITLRISDDDIEKINEAVEVEKRKDAKKRKNFGIGSFLRIAGIAKANRILKKDKQ